MHNYTPNRNSALVLVVDDDPSVRKALDRLLRSADLEVKVFACAAELLAFARPPRPSCLVLDLHLPDMDGFEVLRRIVATDPDLPVVVLTGDTGADTRDRVLQGGAAAFLAKPAEEARLLDVVRRLVESPAREWGRGRG